MGVWIEIKQLFFNYVIGEVTPCMGVWIEIELEAKLQLKESGHSLYGSVD